MSANYFMSYLFFTARSEETTTQPNKIGCNNISEFECENGQCISLSLVCNEEFDCPDRSDERNCSRKSKLLIEIIKFIYVGHKISVRLTSLLDAIGYFGTRIY